jgi:hypothetical protein
LSWATSTVALGHVGFKRSFQPIIFNLQLEKAGSSISNTYIA